MQSSDIQLGTQFHDILSKQPSKQPEAITTAKIPSRISERVPTGITGFDVMIEGGLPKCSNIMVYGEPGTAKSTFCMHFIHTGLKQGEACIYVNTDLFMDDLMLHMKLMGIDVEFYEEKGLLTIIDCKSTGCASFDDRRELKSCVEDPHDLNSLYRAIVNANENMEKFGGAKRIVLDSWTGIQKSRTGDKRRFADTLIRFNKMQGITNLTTFGPALGTDCINNARYMMDGMIEMKSEIVDNMLERIIIVRNMRFTRYNVGGFIFEISDEGIVDASLYRKMMASSGI